MINYSVLIRGIDPIKKAVTFQLIPDGHYRKIMRTISLEKEIIEDIKAMDETATKNRILEEIKKQDFYFQKLWSEQDEFEKAGINESLVGVDLGKVK